MSLSSKQLCGTVVSAGKMAKAVKVRVSLQVYHGFFKKHFASHRDYLVSDPTASTQIGDVVRIGAAGRFSPRIRHVVTEIITPYGSPIEARPALPKVLSPTKASEIAFKSL